MNYKLGELFSGPGGLALGAMNAKVQNGTLGVSVRLHQWEKRDDDKFLTGKKG